jgi:dTDP-4-amino-4,6-dideoxygalactose transaminase
MVVTSDPHWAARMSCLRVHGMEPKYFHKHLGWNARLDALQACMLRVKLPHLEDWIEQRREAAQRYGALLDDRHLTHFLQRPMVKSHRRHTFNQYVVRVSAGQRDNLVRHLKAEGIGCEIYYPMPLHLQECLTYLGHREGDFPCSEEASRCVLALPMFPEITEQQQSRVVTSCAAFFRQPMRRAA